MTHVAALMLALDLAAIALCLFVCWRTCRENDRVWRQDAPRRGLRITLSLSVAWG